jgi:hypothetical protein
MKSGKQRRKRMKMNNLVAKHARTFNKAAVHADRKKDYKRKAKHRNKSED